MGPGSIPQRIPRRFASFQSASISARSLVDGVLTVSITNGTSQTWGAFGGGEKLRASVETTLTNLNGYNPQISVSNSGVGFSSNRVGSLVLKRVRTYTAEGEVVEDNEPKTVYQHE